MAKASFAAGCFWGVQKAFDDLKGVLHTQAGYQGGKKHNPSYNEVCTGSTGHAETVEVEYDPAQISYAELLRTFWKIHDPTQKNRQGPDIGQQYRSVIFYHSLEQKVAAELSLQAEQKSCTHPIITQILPAPTFFPAENYHQHYYR